MKLTVFGATGGIGQEIVRQALESGHQVTAVVRDPARLAVTGAGLEVFRADLMDPEVLRPRWREGTRSSPDSAPAAARTPGSRPS